MRGRSPVPVMLVFGLFLAVVGAAWGWFHIQPRQFPSSLRLEVRRTVPGFTFTPEILSADVLDLLAVSTNDLVNGAFVRPGVSRMIPEERINVFYAGWSARSAREMSVVQHTPDVCWVGAGAVPVALGQPELVDLTLGEGSAPFECRIFQFPNRRRELSLWCTLVSGQVLGEGARFAPGKGVSPGAAPDPRVAMSTSGRRVVGGQFLNALRERVPGTGEKQFVRFSVALDGQDWRGSLDRLKQFAAAWLSLQVTRNPTVAPPTAFTVPADIRL